MHLVESRLIHLIRENEYILGTIQSREIPEGNIVYGVCTNTLNLSCINKTRNDLVILVTNPSN
jgi:hypothetical protein